MDSGFSTEGMAAYLRGADLIAKTGRGTAPVDTYRETMPELAALCGEDLLEIVSKATWQWSRTPNGRVIPAFLETLPSVCRILKNSQLVTQYIDLLFDMAKRSAGNAHGFQHSNPSLSLPLLLENMPLLIQQVDLTGLAAWIEYGIRHYANHPPQQQDYFRLQSADSRAVLQQQRHGTLFSQHERKLSLYLQACWNTQIPLVPFALEADNPYLQQTYWQDDGIRLPDVYHDAHSISGLNRYRAALAHIAAHQRWSQPIIADNFSPQQRLAIECLEDCRVDYLAAQTYAGLQHLFNTLHPKPAIEACDPQQSACLRHRLTLLSRAILDMDYGKTADLPPPIPAFAQHFHDLMQTEQPTTQDMVQLALQFVVQTRLPTDHKPQVYFPDTVVSYRDDNRHLWQYIDNGDEEQSFDDYRQDLTAPAQQGLPPHYYPEWDETTQTYRPDWCSVYENLHRAGNPAFIDALLQKHAALAKRLKQLVERLKPQQHTRIRYQEDGSELDLDIAIRSLIELKSGTNPDPRINCSQAHNGRNIAVLLLLDLSASLNETPQGSTQTLLQLSQEAVSLLAWAIEALGDPFAIAGFASNTRHEVRYQHIKGFHEHWDDSVKARLAALDAAYSTRMGAALRHAAHYLAHQPADKKLLLILTDGEPSDIDVHDPHALSHDTRQAIKELDQQGIYSYCISLDPHADNYVKDIFGKRYTVIDNVQRLPERLPQVFMALTG